MEQEDRWRRREDEGEGRRLVDKRGSKRLREDGSYLDLDDIINLTKTYILLQAGIWCLHHTIAG